LEAAHPCVSKETKSAKFHSLIEKNCARLQKELKEILRALAAVRRRAIGVGIPRAKRAATFRFSDIFAKIGSSVVV